MITEMKVMKYSKKGAEFKKTREILFANKYKGYQFYIMNLGLGPTAYVEIPKDNKFYKIHYNDYDDYNLNLNVHGGVTYTHDYLIISDEPHQTIENSWFVGWDYMHCDDYMPMYEKWSSINDIKLKRWTTDEIFEEVKSAIDEIIKINDDK